MIYIEELKDRISQKEQSEIGRKLLLRGLQIEYGLSELPEIVFGEYGKPYFKSHPEIHFNISHCPKAVVCAINHEHIGVDVECINQFDEELAHYISSKNEFENILSSPDPSLSFTILWTRKESYLKLTGQGLSSRKEIQEILQDNPYKFQSIINEAGGYVVTSCF